MALGQAILVANRTSPDLLLLSPPFSLNLLPWRPSTKLSALGKHKRTWESFSFYMWLEYRSPCSQLVYRFCEIFQGGYENPCIIFASTAHTKILACFMSSSLFFFLLLLFLFAVAVSPCLTTRYGNRFKNIL